MKKKRTCFDVHVYCNLGHTKYETTNPEIGTKAERERDGVQVYYRLLNTAYKLTAKLNLNLVFIAFCQCSLSLTCVNVPHH